MIEGKGGERKRMVFIEKEMSREMGSRENSEKKRK